ncbi:MAG: hypothetical protein DCC88_08690 [Spirobacillus cienkowskii]|jgi:hypothetical protein|uniref:Uncharacterized protein n=1 Tax=Spirobacillus cienkowskii TaxID=495820 RepID=A0A369KSK3_9BACT|nr:MAG: hypothetical protein DCC88_08690 [Spirobacillus cienkowskii]
MSLFIDQNRLLIHYFWTGSLAPITVRRNIANMKNIITLSNSNSEVCLWVRKEDVSNNTIFRKKFFLECFVENQTIKLEYYNLAAMDDQGKYQNIKVIIIDVLIDYYETKFPKIICVLKKMLKYKAYPFASDLVRCLILNFFPGIYSDCDIEPIKNNLFLKDFKSLKDIFALENYSLKIYYMVLFGERGLLENQIIISFEKSCFEIYFAVYEMLLNEEIYFDKTLEELVDYNNNLNKQIVKDLNNSMFNSDEHFPYMKYYSQSKFYQYKKLNEKSGISFSYAVLDLFFNIICEKFEYKDSINYATFFNLKIGKYFKLPIQDSLIYSWKNPGYSRLNKLQDAVNLVTKKVLLKKQKQRSRVFSVPVSTSYLPMQTEERRVTAGYLPMQTEERRITAGYLPMNQNSAPQTLQNQATQNPFLQSLIKKALQQINFGCIINKQDINKIVQLSPIWSPLLLPLQESKDGLFNFSQPIMLSISKIKQYKNYHVFRYVINESGEIILGFDNEIVKINGEKYQNLTTDGYAIASHASLNNYQPVIAAGQVYYDHNINKFTKINNNSGHYRPNSFSLDIAKILFKFHFPNYTNSLKTVVYNQHLV